MNLLRLLSMSAFCGIVASVHAHVPFLKPNQFHVTHDRVQIESSFTEFPFQADFAMNCPRFILIDPKGRQSTLEPTAHTSAAVYLTPKIKQEGTYRIHSQLRKGPKYHAIETTEGKLYFAEEMKHKTGSPTFLQYFSAADTYLSKGEPNYQPEVLKSDLEIIPLSSPNQIFVHQPISFRVYENGNPVSNARIVVVYDQEHYEKHRKEDLYDVENVRKSNIYADTNGYLNFTPPKAGIVLLFVTVHHKISAQLWESHNSSLTLEVQLAPQ